MFKKNGITVIALICAVLSLIVSVFAVGAMGSLKNELDKVTADLKVLMLRQEIQPGGALLESWSLEPVLRSDGEGVDITLTAIPAAHTEGMEAQLHICLGQEATAVPCQWNGKAFTAEAQVAVADGYSYLLVLDGEEIELASPENPTVYVPVYLESSMSYNCTLMVTDWSADGQELTLKNAHVQVNLPQLSADGGAKIRSAALVMRLGTEEVLRKELKLAQGEGEGSFEVDLQQYRLTLPEMEAGDQVDVWVEVILSDGQELLSAPSGWYLDGGKLSLIAG